MKKAQDNLVNIKPASQAGGSMTNAIVNEKKEVIKPDIDPTILKADDRVLIQDLTMATINKALGKVEALAKEALKKSTKVCCPTFRNWTLNSMMR